MPYADPERRRAFDRERKRRERQRRKSTLSTPGEPERKAYYYTEGKELLVTANPQTQAAIEGNIFYGETIFSWRVEP